MVATFPGNSFSGPSDVSIGPNTLPDPELAYADTANLFLPVQRGKYFYTISSSNGQPLVNPTVRTGDFLSLLLTPVELMFVTPFFIKFVNGVDISWHAGCIGRCQHFMRTLFIFPFDEHDKVDAVKAIETIFLIFCWNLMP